MFHKSSFCVLVAMCCMYLTSNCVAAVALEEVIQTNPLDEHQYASNLDCHNYSNDLDILAGFSFPVKLNPSLSEFYEGHASVAETSADGTFVQRIAIKNEKVVPSSLFCLSNLTTLQIESTPFETDEIPDAFANLQALKYLIVHFVPIKRITEQFGTLTNLEIVTFMQCSLNRLPRSLNQLLELKILNLPYNSLTGIDELAQAKLEILDLTGNNLTAVPVLKNKENLTFLSLGFNQLKNLEPMILYSNLQYVSLYHAGLTSLPASIDKLQEVQQLLLDDNQLTDLPHGIFNMPKMYYLGVTNNLFSAEYIESVKEAFKQHHPTAYLSI